MRVCVLCSSFNRASTTLAGLSSLSDALRGVPDLSFSIFLLDDASPDGTASKVREALPDVTIVHGTGAMFWNTGMIAAYEAARAGGNSSWDAYLLFNDDTNVDSDGVRQFFEHYRNANKVEPTACVGRLIDPDTGVSTYGGYICASRHHPLRVAPVESEESTVACDTFNGNFVLIPGASFEAIGGLCSKYWHSYGDLDAGYALTKQGTHILLISAPIGTARRNPPFDMSTCRKRYRRLFGAPNTIAQTYAFYRRNGCAADWWIVATASIIKKWCVVLGV